VEFLYNDKKYMAIEQTLFELNFGRHPFEGNLMVQTKTRRIPYRIRKKLVMIQ